MAADGRIEIDTRIEKQNVEQELRQLKREIRLMAKEMQLANYKGMMPFQKQLLESQKKMYNLAATMHQFSGTNAEFMQQVKQLGAEYKKANDAMINANNMAKVSMIQTAGQMMNMTTQAKRISDNYDRMGNVLYKVNKAGLAVADRMNQIANNGNAAVLALRMLGPTASMKQLLDMQRMITQGIMRFQMVALGAAVTGALLYSSLHEAAKKANKEYAQSFETMLAALRKAFEPMVQVFAEVMTHVYKFITAIANMIIKFNEAHPVLAKVLQGILMLIPALTLLLSPLAIGIGLLAGFQAAWASIWTMIGPLVTGLAAMSATVWIVAAAIVGLTAFLVHLWKTNEGFRNAVINAWNQIKSTAVNVWNFIWNSILQPIWSAIVTYGKQVIEQLRQFWNQNGEQIKQAAQNVWSFISTYISTHLQTILTIFQAVFPVIKQIVQTAWTFIKEVISGALQIIMGLIKTFASVLTGDWKGAWEGVKQIVNGAVQVILAVIKTSFIGRIIDAIKTLGTSLINSVQSMWNSAKSIFNSSINAVKSIVTSGFNAIKSFISSTLNAIRSTTSSIWNSIKSTISSAVNGIRSTVTSAFNTIRSIASSVWNAIKSSISSAVNTARSTVSSAFSSMRSAVSSAMSNIRSTITSMWSRAVSFLRSINLYSVGRNIIQGLLKGISSMASAVIAKAKSIANSITKTIKSALSIHSPSRVMRDEIGKWIPLGMAEGIDKYVDTVKLAALKMAELALPNIQQIAATPSITTNNHAPITVNLKYNGVGDIQDAYNMVDILERELSYRLINRLRMSGVRV